jgi:hypothetical protein
MVEYFNKWALTFVGIKGVSYLQGGRQVISLFKQRGWSSLIADGLADGVMTVMKMSIAVLTGKSMPNPPFSPILYRVSPSCIP